MAWTDVSEVTTTYKQSVYLPGIQWKDADFTWSQLEATWADTSDITYTEVSTVS